jgi:hypothetical protein
MSVAFSVQKAVDEVLVPVLAALTPAVPLYDGVPDSPRFPFVSFSRSNAVRDNLMAENMTRVQITLTVFSEFRGQEQVLTILRAIEVALDDAELDLDDGTAVRCDLERADTTLDADGKTYTGTAIYAVLVAH